MHVHTFTHLNFPGNLMSVSLFLQFYGFYRLARILPFDPKMSEMKADDLNCIITSMFVIKMALFIFMLHCL